MTVFQRLADAARPLDLSQIAREEFEIVAKAYFAPIYGAVLVLRQVMQRPPHG